MRLDKHHMNPILSITLGKEKGLGLENLKYVKIHRKFFARVR